MPHQAPNEHPISPDEQIPSVCAVIVTYGERAGLALDTASRALKEGADHVILVNNGGRLQSTGYHGPAIETIHNTTNFGSAVGFSQGISAAVAGDWTHILLLDDDNVLDHGALTRLLTRQLQNRHRRLCSARRMLADPTNPHKKVDLFPTRGRRNAFLSFDAFGQIRGSPAEGMNHNRSHARLLTEAPYGGLLLPATAIHSLGLPRADFVLYEDDTEYTLRATALGFEIVLVDEAIIFDQGQKWSQQKSGRAPRRMVRSRHAARLYYSTRNRIYVERHILRTNGIRYWLNAAVFALALLCSVRHPGDVKNLRIIYRATSDGLRARLGERYPLASISAADAASRAALM